MSKLKMAILLMGVGNPPRLGPGLLPELNVMDLEDPKNSKLSRASNSWRGGSRKKGGKIKYQRR